MTHDGVEKGTFCFANNKNSTSIDYSKGQSLTMQQRNKLLRRMESFAKSGCSKQRFSTDGSRPNNEQIFSGIQPYKKI